MDCGHLKDQKGISWGFRGVKIAYIGTAMMKDAFIMLSARLKMSNG